MLEGLGVPKIHYPFKQPPADTDVLWRAEGKRYAYIIDADSDRWGTTDLAVELTWHVVTRRTPKGAWIAGRFVRLDARKCFACETEKEALESYIARKKRQIGILTAQLKEAQRGLLIAETELDRRGTKNPAG